jgi:hypothetical protein
MTIPQFVKLEHDTAARKAFVSVEDRDVKKQREMWGMSIYCTTNSRNEVLMKDRNHTRISPKSYPGRVRRPYSHSSISGCWIQSYG